MSVNTLNFADVYSDGLRPDLEERFDTIERTEAIDRARQPHNKKRPLGVIERRI